MRTYLIASLFFLLTLPLLANEEPKGVPPLKVVYFTPSDRTPPPDRQERLGRVMKHIQDFYRKGMEANGHGPKTFALEWETPEKLRLYDVQGERNFEDYPKGSEQIVGMEVQNALKQRGINIEEEYTLILGPWVEWKEGIAREIGPYGGNGNMFSGYAFACDDKFIDADLLASKEPGGFHYMVGPCSLGMYNTLYIGGIAHELGHAFGLPHDSERDSQRETLGISLMGVGNHYYGKALRDGEGHDTFQLGKYDAFLSAASALVLSEIRAFNPNFTQSAREFRFDQIEQRDTSFQDGKLIVNIKVSGEPLPIGAIAYNDNVSKPGDYDAKTWLAVSENPGEFRWEIDELEQVPYEMRLVFVVPSSRTEISVQYSNESGAPTAQGADGVSPPTCYVMSYFTGNGESGLHLCWSEDALTWKTLNDGKSFMTPTVGNHKLVRDPSIVQAPDGTFHMVWTISWTQRGIGYAHSKDLTNWSEQKLIPVMENEPTVRNCWAPELFYDEPSETYYIFWSSTVPGKFEGIGSEDDYNHRQYYVTTKDFMTFSPTKLFFEPGHNVIDGFLAKEGEQYLLFYKDETLRPEPKKSIHLAIGKSPTGPFEPQMEIGHRNWIEGPSAIKIGDYWHVYYDHYRTPQHYGAVRSKDLKTWENITESLSFPQGIRHGTIFRVTPEIVRGLENFKSN